MGILGDGKTVLQQIEPVRQYPEKPYLPVFQIDIQKWPSKPERHFCIKVCRYLIKADNGNRTRLSSLGSWRSTNEPYLHYKTHEAIISRFQKKSTKVIDIYFF